MDLSFFRRGQHSFAERTSARLDYGVLVATLEAVQTASAAAAAEVRAAGSGAISDTGHDPLAELLLGGPAWRAAIGTLAGCFNPAQADRRRKDDIN